MGAFEKSFWYTNVPLIFQNLFALPLVRRFVFGLELLALILSMWISNVAGPVICLTGAFLTVFYAYL